DQILPCFLVDEVALPAAVAKLRQAVALIREPWPIKPTAPPREAPEEDAPAETQPARGDEEKEELLQAPRWRRGDRQTSSLEPDSGDATLRPSGAEAEVATALPYGGDLQAAMRAQDRAAIKLLMTLRDQSQAPKSAARRTRWGQKKEEKEETRRPSDSRQLGGTLIHRAGDLLQAKEDFIVHQCNCVYSGSAQGVAEAVFKAHPDADVYRCASARCFREDRHSAAAQFQKQAFGDFELPTTQQSGQKCQFLITLRFSQGEGKAAVLRRGGRVRVGDTPSGQEMYWTAAYHRGEEDPLPPLQPPLQQRSLAQAQAQDEDVLFEEDVLRMLAEMRRVPPALRLVKDALVNYQRSSKQNVKGQERERLSRARKCLYPTPELTQAAPLPSKDPPTRATSSRSTSAGPSTATPRLPSSPWWTGSRPATTGHPTQSVWPQAPHNRPRTSPNTSTPAIAKPRMVDLGPGSPTSLPIPQRRAFGSMLSVTSQRSSMESLMDVLHTHSVVKKNASRKVASRLAMLAGRLHHKVFLLRAKQKNACELARSCRKRVITTRTKRQEEKNIAAAAIHSRQLEEWGPNPVMSTSVRRARTGVVSEADKSKREEAAAEEKTQEPDISKKVREEAPTPTKEKEAFNSFKAHSMSMDYNLPGGHVTQAWKLFKHYDTNDDDLLSPYEFQLLLRTVLRERYPRAKDVPRELFKEAIEIQQTQISVTFEDFLTWITRNAFQECLLLTDEQRFIRLVARRFYVSVPDVEKVKRRFDSFCQANPGLLEYQEFCQLIALLLNLRDTTALPESRVKSFWRELDDTGKGSVDFTEFIPWYLGYFGGDDGSSLVNFYRRIRPTVFEDD
ncbi:unnamed protein product, partial [Symbiodinium microadriaticum]